MRRFLVAMALLAAVGGGGYWYLRAHPRAIPRRLVAPSRWLLQEVTQAARQVTAQAASVIHHARTTVRGWRPAPQPPTVPAASPSTPQRLVTLYLANGGMVTGELVRETPEEVVIRWEEGEIGFQRSELARIVQGKRDTDAGHLSIPWEGGRAEAAWPYQHEVVVKLTRGTVVDSTITGVSAEAVHLTQFLPEGGAIEHTIPRADVEQVVVRPMATERSQEIARTLATRFPEMRAYPEGLFTIVTDSGAPAVKDYRRTIRALSTEWYLTFFPLVNDRSPTVQQHVVIFDDWGDYIEYAATDGVPGWLAVGYFNPEDQVLYCFNMIGERFSELLYDAYLGQFRDARDRFSTQLTGSRRALFIEGQLSEFLRKLEDGHSAVRQLFRQISVEVLRHELTHAMFHNWRLQGVVLSQVGEPGDEVATRASLDAAGEEERRRLLDELLGRGRGAALPERHADNSWVVEGLAGYMEPSPVGGIHRERLAGFQDARRHGQVLPLEFLHLFRMGSFVGMTTQSALYAYAQSWALCHFLMTRYPDGFMAYLGRVARERPAGGEETLSWLLAALGKEQRLLEQEFLAYMERFPPEDPPWLAQMQMVLDMRRELTALASRLWSR